MNDESAVGSVDCDDFKLPVPFVDSDPHEEHVGRAGGGVVGCGCVLDDAAGARSPYSMLAARSSQSNGLHHNIVSDTTWNVKCRVLRTRGACGMMRGTPSSLPYLSS